MTDFALFDKALKLCWVKRLCSDELSPWKIIPTSLLSNVGGNLLFRCSYDAKYLKLSDQLPSFYKNLIIYWQVWYNYRCKTTATLTKNNIIYGLVDNFTSCLTLNHLVLLGKYFLYKCAINEARLHFVDFRDLVQEKIDLERYIAVQAKKTSAFFKKWQFFL